MLGPTYVSGPCIGLRSRSCGCMLLVPSGELWARRCASKQQIREAKRQCDQLSQRSKRVDHVSLLGESGKGCPDSRASQARKPIQCLLARQPRAARCSRRLTFELSGRQRQDARPGLAKMYRVPPDRAWWPAVGAPLERGVRHHSADAATAGCTRSHWFPCRSWKTATVPYSSALGSRTKTTPLALYALKSRQKSSV